jgi:DNA-binding MarR family transcriptional regulator/GNAT superfamily N-acetyltransferase
MLDPVARFCRFARAVTTEVGALDDSFLGLGRPLGAARVLNAIGQGMGDIGRIRAYLRLDSGLLSRLLRGLEDERVIETHADPLDARRRVAWLTEKGLAEFALYEKLSNERAGRLLDGHPQREALLAAMDLVATALGRDTVSIEETDPRSAAARHCLGEYYGELARRFERGFDVNLSRDPEATAMMRPKGVFLLALSDGLPIGCAGLKGGGRDAVTGEAYGEIKRLWIAPAARGLGLGRRIMDHLEDAALSLGMPLLRLDTNSALHEAAALYRRSGWTEIGRFNDDPYPDMFFEKRITPRS